MKNERLRLYLIELFLFVVSIRFSKTTHKVKTLKTKIKFSQISKLQISVEHSGKTCLLLGTKISPYYNTVKYANINISLMVNDYMYVTLIAINLA